MHNIRSVDFDGKGPGVGDKHASPNETSIHGEDEMNWRIQALVVTVVLLLYLGVWCVYFQPPIDCEEERGSFCEYFLCLELEL